VGILNLRLPRFLDVEASSLSINSHPIEIGWSDELGNISSFLINPSTVEAWTDWSSESQKIHGISKELCIKEGIAPELVCKYLSDSISPNENIYCDGGIFDEYWVDTLFGAGSEMGFAQFRILHSDSLMLSLLANVEKNVAKRLALFEELKQESRQIVVQRHRAAVDVFYLIELYKLCLSISRKI